MKTISLISFVFLVSLGSFGAGLTMSATNGTMYTSGNRSAGIAVANNSPFGVGTSSGVMLDFFGLGPTNTASLLFGTTVGNSDYGIIGLNTTHNNTLGRSQDVELEIESGSHIALIPGISPAIFGGGDHVQIGIGSNPTTAYMKSWGTGNTGFNPNQIANSGYMGYGVFYNSNGIASWTELPGFMAHWLSSTNFPITAVEWSLDIEPDQGSDALTDSYFRNLQRFRFGTNLVNNQLFWRADLSGGMDGSKTNHFTVDTNQISVAGTMTFTNQADTLNAPNFLNAGEAGAALIVQSNIVFIGTDTFFRALRVNDGSSQSDLHSYITAGPDYAGVTMFLGGLTVGVNANTASRGSILATNNITSGNIVTATNGIASFATNMLALSSTGITNTLSVNLRVIGFTGTTVTQTNLTSHTTFSLGTITQPALIILQPTEALRGSSCASVTNLAL